MDTLGGAEFAPETTYLNTSSCGLLPGRAVEAVRTLAAESAKGRRDGAGSFDSVTAARASYARLVGVPAERVAVGHAVAVHVGLIAGSLAPGSEVLMAEGEFSSVVTPFAVRGDLRPRYVPLEKLADEVRPETALVAVSAVQSADGRIADLPALRAATSAHGARTLLDTTQAAGWLPVEAGAYDYTVAGGYKFLVSPRGTSFLTVTEEAQEGLVPLHAGWVAGEDIWASTYGPVERLAHSARRFDEPVAFLAYHGAEQSLALLEEIGVERIRTHVVALADRFRAGLVSLGHEPVAADGSTVVAVAGLGDREARLAEAGVEVSVRAGNLRAAFHLYNSAADVDRALDVLAG
ncbi:aminotransferase class V-fold PLP-dependent enzyme [Streptomyces sp. NBC_01498]|uniref:aminotransferase class V-fold PLP-dependent enzyme n=1 Tax=Streptomyces sp. NBC_01498 TaxID=2975870 RepID=UPI002E7B6588|nr:aminotransferase class V-fold PLP-dependent enzyme [Streptomyces sp. NBC_01498]WTL27492.1 aminotransferase class V-fold PLP-dependent enzyme [Streptomyces sp. NBC_01498]